MRALATGTLSLSLLASFFAEFTVAAADATPTKGEIQLTSDTVKKTVDGAAFVAPAGWWIETVVPGFMGSAFVMGNRDKSRTLTFRDAQHEYVFTEKK